MLRWIDGLKTTSVSKLLFSMREGRAFLVSKAVLDTLLQSSLFCTSIQIIKGIAVDHCGLAIQFLSTNSKKGLRGKC